MKLLITGSNGLLGQHLVPQLLHAHHQVIALGRGPQKVSWQGMVKYQDLDITHYRELKDLILREKPDTIVHSAAMTQVDDCEKNKTKCREVNVTATENLLDAAGSCAGHFIFLSTDFVFDGDKGNYREEDPVNPVNWYGQTKVEAEHLVKQYPYPWSVARTCLLYGISKNSSRTNIIVWIKSALEKGEQIRVVNDQVRTPTDVKDFARGIEKILNQGAVGFFHLSGNEVMTPYQMALATADFFSLDKSKIEEVNSDNFSQIGKRPLKTGFDIRKAQQVLGFSPSSLRTGLGALKMP
ncbi:MAG: SDR family oxidoreductase [Puia sp.]